MVTRAGGAWTSGASLAALRKRARDAESEGRLDDAIDALTEACERDRSNAKLQATRARLLLRQKRPTEALRGLEGVLALSPDEPRLHAMLAHAHEALGDVEAAFGAWRKAVALEPRNDTWRNGLGRLRRKHRLPPPARPSLLEGRLAGDALQVIVEPYADWCRGGVRDPAILVDGDGHPVRFRGRYRLFFNARDRDLVEGGRSVVGWAASDDLEHWEGAPEPVFSFGAYATTPGAMLDRSDTIRLYFASDTARAFRLAESEDGQAWRVREQALLSPADLGCRRFGLPFVFRDDGAWYLLCEGLRSHFNIYGARSEDGLVWHPLNGGEPLYLPYAGAWDSLRQANPSVARIAGDKTAPVLLYNGSDEPDFWDLGLLRPTGDVTRPWLPHPKPLLGRADLPETATRVEGVRWLPFDDGGARLLFFTLPEQDGFAGGKIWQARLGPDDVRHVMEAAIAPSAPRVEPQPRHVAANRRPPLGSAPARSGHAFDHGAQVRAEEAFNDTFAERYFDIWDSWPIQRVTRDLEGQWLRDLVAPGETVLLVGSGGGRELEALLDCQVTVTAMDLSEAMLEAGRRRFQGQPVVWVRGDAHEPPKTLRSFDHAIGVGCVFCYLPDPERALANLRDTLRVGGQLTLGVINKDHFTEQDADRVLASGRVRRLFSVADMRRLLAQAGYIVQEVRGHRFYIDALPAEWNSGFGTGAVADGLIGELAALERKLSAHLDAERAKHLWVTARAI